MKRLLVIDATEAHAKALSNKLSADHYACDMTTSLKKGVEALEKDRADLVLVDWTVAEPGFADFVMTLKRNNKKVSVIVYSDRPGKEAEIAALNSGADDYCEKPVVKNEIEASRYGVLLSRIEARLRFGGTNVIDVGDLVIDPDEEKIYYLKQENELKGKPFEVLTHLARHRDQIVSKEQLLDAIWEEPELVTPNVIEVAINQIRQKMDKPLGIGTIETVRRRGYRFCFPNCSGQTITDR
ncbi:MAG: homeostatic response regulator transcription factor HsrA [Campylobacterales bacterium]